MLLWPMYDHDLLFVWLSFIIFCPHVLSRFKSSLCLCLCSCPIKITKTKTNLISICLSSVLIRFLSTDRSHPSPHTLSFRCLACILFWHKLPLKVKCSPSLFIDCCVSVCVCEYRGRHAGVRWPSCDNKSLLTRCSAGRAQNSPSP